MMTSVFSSIVQQRKPASKSVSGNGQDHGLSDEKPDDLRSLNHALDVLVQVFSDVQPEVFREMLANVSESSRLEIVTEQLLRSDVHHVQGRYRPKRNGADALADEAVLGVEDRFRSSEYKTAVRQALHNEFRGLSHSAIRAVLAECNDHYTTARRILIDISSKSWRASFSNFLFRRKTPAIHAHPFVSQKGPAPPVLISTQNEELDQEIRASVIEPAIVRERQARCIIDNALAHQLAESDAKEAKEEYDCDVCYSTSSIFNIAVCDDGGHFTCFRCIDRTITEAIYGQGWSRSIEPTRGTMRCVAPVLSGPDCHGCIPRDLVERALADKQAKGQLTLQTFEQRLVTNELQSANIPLAHCPFCPYLEIDDLDSSLPHWRFRNPHELRLTILSLLLVLTSLGSLLLLLPFVPLCLLSYTTSLNPLRASLVRVARKSRGLRFRCRSPSCGRRSCTRCHALWRDPHACFESSLLTLSRSIEAAQTRAVKRVCPRCDLAFVKSSGCNKLACPCGYIMCYLCRAQIGRNEGYAHFCGHFREKAGRCALCDKCDLYVDEDEEELLRRARRKVEREWVQGHGMGMGLGADVKDREQVRALIVGAADTTWWNQERWREWIDGIVERMIVVYV